MHLFNLEIHTVLALLCAGNIASLVVLLSYNCGKRYISYRYFAVGRFLQACAWFLLVQRGSVPDALSVYAGNSMLFCGFGFEALAMTKINRSGLKWEGVYFALTITGVIVFIGFQSPPDIRVGISSAVTALLFGTASAAMMVSYRHSFLRFGLGVFYGLFSIVLAVRSGYGFFSHGGIFLFTANLVQTLTFLPVYILMLVGGTGFLLMLKERDDILLSESEEKYRTLVEKADEGIVIIKDRRFVFVNSRMEGILGVSSSSLIGKSFESFVFPDDRSMVFANYDRRSRGEIVPDLYDFRLMHSNGSTCWVSLSGSRIMWEGSSAVMGLLTDINLRKKAEAEKAFVIADLQKALADVKTLSGLLPICASCRKVRDDRGYWNQIEDYVRSHTDANFSHSICPDCAEKLYPGFNHKK